MNNIGTSIRDNTPIEHRFNTRPIVNQLKKSFETIL